MKIGGIVPFSLCDFPGRVAAVVFTQGCNFRCPYCHNGALIAEESASEKHVAEEDVLRFLRSRVGALDGVVVSGGEPTLQPDLPQFAREVKAMGYALKLDTNGSHPDVLRILLETRQIDFVAMDLKAPLHRYVEVAGAAVAPSALRDSIDLIARSQLPHEFRTTVVPALLDDEDLRAIAALVPPGSPHRWQPFEARHALAPWLRTPRATPSHRRGLQNGV